jgi:hypothetical protein
VIRARDLKVKVFRFETDAEWHDVFSRRYLVWSDGYVYNMFRCEYSKRIMFMYRSHKSAIPFKNK